MAQEVTEFDELLDLLRGMRGQMVEAMVFLPWDDAQFPVTLFSGTIEEVTHRETPRDSHWIVSWVKDGEGKPRYPEIVLWERRFIRAELSFTGDADEGLAMLDEPQGQNTFLKIDSEGWILDLTSYV
jgi:hypothetical protein